MVAMMQPKVSVGAPAWSQLLVSECFQTVMASCKACAQSLGRHSEKVESLAAGVFPWRTLQVKWVGGAAFCFVLGDETSMVRDSPPGSEILVGSLRCLLDIVGCCTSRQHVRWCKMNNLYTPNWPSKSLHNFTPQTNWSWSRGDGFPVRDGRWQWPLKGLSKRLAWQPLIDRQLQQLQLGGHSMERHPTKKQLSTTCFIPLFTVVLSGLMWWRISSYSKVVL